MKTITGKVTSACALIAVMLIIMPGCASIKKLISKTPPEGIEQESFGETVYVYEADVTVKASVDEIIEYIAVEMFSLDHTAGITSLGNEFELAEKSFLMPFRHRENTELWLMNVSGPNDKNWVLCRFGFKPGQDNTQVKVKFTLTPDNETFVNQGGKTDVFDESIMDMKKHFDSNVPQGYMLNNNLIESIFQAYEASTWVDCSMEELADWLSEPENYEKAMGGYEGESEAIITEHLEYRTIYMNMLGRQFAIDTFTVGDFETYLNYDTYLVWMNNVSRFSFYSEEEAGGVRIRESLVSEIPAGMGADVMDLMIMVSGFPDQMKHSLVTIKEGVENDQ